MMMNYGPWDLRFCPTCLRCSQSLQCKRRVFFRTCFCSMHSTRQKSIKPLERRILRAKRHPCKSVSVGHDSLESKCCPVSNSSCSEQDLQPCFACRAGFDDQTDIASAICSVPSRLPGKPLLTATAVQSCI